MINLLPPKEKEELALEKEKKLVMVLGYLTLISLVCLSLVLFALKFYILEKAALEKNILENVQKEYQGSDFLSLRDSIEKYNILLAKADNFYKKEIYLSDALKTILNINRPQGVYFTNIALVKDEKEQNLKVNISGTSNTRDNLLTLKDSIERLSSQSGYKTEKVYFPPDSWVKSLDINFYVTFDIRPVK